MERTVQEWIKQRRRQMLLHSFMYYRMGESLVSDEQFDKWARELLFLQTEYPQESLEVEFYEDFKTWDATTGYHLSFHEYDWLEPLARSMLDYHK
jgi:NAD-dependent DNA ligase